MQGGQAAAKYKQGVQNYQGNPMAEAAKPESQALYLQNTSDAVNSGRMAARLNATDPNSWKQNALNIGAANLANGAKKGAPKYQKMADKLSSVWAQQRSAVQGMPKGGRGNAKARANAALDIMMDAFGKS
jgi:hypothetical protein